MSDPDAADHMLAGLQAVPGGIWRSYLAPDAKVMFVSLNKNACTSLKWMMADLAGEDLETFRAGWRPYVADSEAVHDRSLWKVSPKFGRLSPEQRTEIAAGEGWFVFGVVRDPRLRVASAWQNKLLLENPINRQWAAEWWYPRHPLTRDSVIEDFAKFVDLLDSEPPHRLRARDAHFMDQVDLLAEHVVPYTRIYEISEIRRLRQDLTAHLEAMGRPRELYLPRANPTPLPAIGALFENGVREKIERIYAADFERFGEQFADRWDFSRTMDAAPWTETQLLTAENESVLGRRIAELHRMARTQRDKGDVARQKVEKLKRELADTPSRRSLLSRLRTH